jgi:hypothetical protein
MGLELVPVFDDAVPLSYWYRVLSLPWFLPRWNRRMIPF